MRNKKDLKKLDESIYWFELLVESGFVPGLKMANLMSEANELTAIFVTIIKQTKENNS